MISCYQGYNYQQSFILPANNLPAVNLLAVNIFIKENKIKVLKCFVGIFQMSTSLLMLRPYNEGHVLK